MIRVSATSCKLALNFGYFFRVSTSALMRKGVGVSLEPAFS